MHPCTPIERLLHDKNILDVNEDMKTTGKKSDDEKKVARLHAKVRQTSPNKAICIFRCHENDSISSGLRVFALQPCTANLRPSLALGRPCFSPTSPSPGTIRTFPRSQQARGRLCTLALCMLLSACTHSCVLWGGVISRVAQLPHPWRGRLVVHSETERAQTASHALRPRAARFADLLHALWKSAA